MEILKEKCRIFFLNRDIMFFQNRLKVKFSIMRKVEYFLQMEQGRFIFGEGCWYEIENFVDVINC